jgi:hypothetical protein
MSFSKFWIIRTFPNRFPDVHPPPEVLGDVCATSNAGEHVGPITSQEDRREMEAQISAPENLRLNC